MSMVMTDNGEFIDTDYDVVFWHKDGRVLSESDAVELGYTDEDGEYSG